MKCILSLIVSLLISSSVTAQTSYTITDLGAGFPGTAINNSGQVAGTTSNTADGNPHAFLYSGGVTTDIGTMGGSQASVGGIGSSGQIVGRSSTPSDLDTDAFLYNQGSWLDLGNLGGDFSGAGAINNSGQIVGSSFLPGDYTWHAFLYSAGTGIVDLNSQIPNGSGWTLVYGESINDSAQITGVALTPQAPNGSRAYIYSSSTGVLTDLGTLSGQGSSEGTAINNSGQVTGTSSWSYPSGYPGHTCRHAFFYSAGTMTDLGTFDNAFIPGCSSGNAINNLGQATGSAYVYAPYEEHAFLYSQSAGMVDVNSLLTAGSGWTLRSGNGINDAGQITGEGVFNGESLHGFILSPPVTQQLTNLVNTLNLPAAQKAALLSYIPNITTAISSLSTKQKTTYISQLQKFASAVQSSGLPTAQTTPLLSLVNDLIAAL